MSLLLLLRTQVAPGAGVLRNYTVGNQGTADIIVGTLTLEAGTGDVGAFEIEEDNASGATIPPGETRGFRVRFLPTVAGSYLASVRIPSSDDDGALTIALIGEAVAALTPGRAVDPLTHDYGSIDTATGSAVKVFTVSSTGTGPLVCGTAVLGGAGASSYALSANGVSGATIPAGQSRTVTVTFDPTSDGTKAGTLTIPSDGGADVVVALTGVGTTGAPAPEPALVSRFYLSRQAAPIDGVEAANWDRFTLDDDHLLATARGGPAVAWGTSLAHTGVSGQRVRLGRWTSPPLAAQVIDTPFRCYAVGYRASALGANVTSAIRFGIWRDADDTYEYQPVLAMGDAGGSAWPLSTGPLPRRFPRGEDWSWRLALDIEDGDRLICELGFRAFSTSTGVARIRWGGGSTATDLAATQDVQDIDLAPWIDFESGLLVLP